MEHCVDVCLYHCYLSLCLEIHHHHRLRDEEKEREEEKKASTSFFVGYPLSTIRSKVDTFISSVFYLYHSFGTYALEWVCVCIGTLWSPPSPVR